MNTTDPLTEPLTEKDIFTLLPVGKVNRRRRQRKPRVPRFDNDHNSPGWSFPSPVKESRNA